MNTYLLPGIIFLFIVIMLIRRRLNAPKRKKRFAELAESLGMTLVPDFPYRSRFGFGLFQTPEEKRYSTKTLKNLPTLPILTKTKHMRVTNPLIGDPEKFGLEQEVTVTILEYVLDQGKAKYFQTVIHISDPKLDLPYFSLSPQKVFSKAVNFFTKEKDIDFELSRTGTEFSKQFLLIRTSGRLHPSIFHRRYHEIPYYDSKQPTQTLFTRCR
tara:strand:- start:3450 stop:4088 length:639 start_codon:yes stop_codon:yes gene_type:complete